MDVSSLSWPALRASCLWALLCSYDHLLAHGTVPVLNSPRVQADKQKKRREKSCVVFSTSPLTPPGWSYQEWRPPSDHIWQSLDSGQERLSIITSSTTQQCCDCVFIVLIRTQGLQGSAIFCTHCLWNINYAYFFLPPQKPKKKRSSGSEERTIFIEK